MPDFINPVSMPLSPEPDRRYPLIAPYMRDRATTPMSDAEAAPRLEQLKRQRNGIKVKIEEVQVQIDTEHLRQKNLELGTERLKTQISQQKYHQTGHQLVSERFKTAGLRDVSITSNQEWRLNQESARQKIDGIRLGVNEQIGKNDEKDRLIAAGAFGDLGRRFAPNADNN